MADERRLSADEVANRTFATSFRGLDAGEVRAYLDRVADELRAAEQRESDLAVRLKAAEQRADSPDIDEDTLLRLLGDETARVMRSAREAATDLRARAEENVEQILREAHDESKRLRAAAESVLNERSKLAEAEADQIRAHAAREADAAIEAAKADAESMLNQAREHGKAMVVEAQAARERILSDLARRRRVAHVQVEQLRAGRDRLLEAYRMVRSTLEDVTDELQRAEHEAREAADAAARKLAEGDIEAGAAAAVEGGIEAAAEAEAGAPATEAEQVVELDAESVAPEDDDDDEPQSVLVTTTVAADSPAPVTAEPSRPASVPVEEKRLSSLRLLRKPKGDEPEPEVASAAAATSELAVVEPQPAEEGVRIVAPVAAAEAVEEAEAAIDGEPPSKAVVDDLFARIRASREESVEHAREVLAEPAASPEPAVAEEVAPIAEAPVSNEDELALQRRDEVVGEIQAKLARKLKRSLQDEQNDLLDRLRSARGKIDGVVPDESEHAARHVAVAVPFLREAGGDVDVTPIAATLVEAIVQPLRRQIDRAVHGQSDHEDTDVAGRIGTAYREWKGDRIERLAGDAVVAAWSQARFAEVPDGAALRWIVDDEGGPCPDCDDNALAGPTPKGEEFPTGQQHPPAHAGCRCLVVRSGT